MEDYFIERTFLNQYRAETFLGRGGFGKVYKIKDKNDLTRYFIRQSATFLNPGQYKKIKFYLFFF